MKLRQVISAVLALGLPGYVLAQPGIPYAPRIWANSAPPVANPNVTPHVRIWMPSCPQPRDASAAAHDFMVLHPEITEGKVTLAIYLLGRRGTQGQPSLTTGPYLWCHPLDALAPGNIPADLPHGYPTPWTWNGINGPDGTGPWMDLFIESYKSYGHPAPVRLLLDSELAFIPEGHAAYHLYVALQRDPRWATQEVAGYPPGTTMAMINPPGIVYNDQIDFDSGSQNPSRDEIANKVWYNWFAGVMAQIMDGTSSKAVYERLRLPTNFPACVCGDYNASHRVDGLGYPPRVVRDANSPGSRWFSYVYSGSGQKQPISFYPVYDDLINIGENVWDATVRWWGRQVDACIDSFEGSNHEEMSLWVYPIGGLAPASSHPATKEYVRQVFAFGKSRNVQDFDIFNGAAQPQTEFNEGYEAIEEALCATLSQASLPAWLYQPPVTLTDNQVIDLQYALTGAVQITGTSRSPFDASIETKFVTSLLALGCTQIEAIVEAQANVSAKVTLRALNVNTNQWDVVGDSNGTSSDLVRRRFTQIPAGPYVAPDSTCKLRLDYHSTGPVPLAVTIDLIQLIGIRP